MERSDERPIGREEVEHHLIHVQRAIEAQTDDERRAALTEGLLRFGHRFGFGLDYLRSQANRQGVFQTLFDEYVTILGGWLSGARLTDRADEDERRASVALSTLKMGEVAAGIQRLAARAILELPDEHPQRNATLARDVMLQHLRRSQESHVADDLVLTIHDLVEYELEPSDRLQELIDQGRRHLDQVSDPDVRRNFHVVVMGHYAKRAIAARDAGDGDGCQHWGAKVEAQLEQVKEAPADLSAVTRKNLLAGALAMEILEKPDKAADTYALAIDPMNPTEHVSILAARHEGRLRGGLGDYERVVAVLAPIVGVLEERYLTAVEDADVREAGEEFSKAVANLAFSHASLRRWNDALSILDRGKSLRLRYRAALRESPAGQRLLELETALHALSRGVLPEQVVPSAERTADWLAAEISLRVRVLEEYRTQRPKLTSPLLASPSVRDIATCLARDETVCILGTGFAGTLLAMVFPGDDREPGGRLLLEDWPLSRVVRILAGTHQDGWLYVLGAPELGLSHKQALSQLLTDLEEMIGAPLRGFLRDRDVRRITIVPHHWLHLVPLWALPSLSGYEVVMAPSTAHLVGARRQARAIKKTALAIADPTLNLPVSSAEVGSLRHHLSAAGWDIGELSRGQSTEEALNEALAGVSLFHFCGHGLSNLIQPTRSALRVHPDPGRFHDQGTDPFPTLLANAKEWRDAGDGERCAEVPGVGRLYEKGDPETAWVERRLEYAPRGTLWGLYKGGKLFELAELWTAGDIMVQDTLRRCQLAFLSACETGTGSLEVEIDEYSGLPAALQLAGISTVICTLWPVPDVLTALYVDLFYEAFAKAQDPVNVAALVRGVADRLRRMGKQEAAQRLADLRRRTSDPVARFRLEAAASAIGAGEECPYSHPYDWASFYVTGASGIGRAGEGSS